MQNKFIFLAVFPLVLAACGGGGGGDGGGGGGGGSTPGKIAGTLNVAPSNRLEVERNDSPLTAQSINAGESIVGRVNELDSGFVVTVPGVNGPHPATIHDAYRITIANGLPNVRIVLTMAQDNVSVNDLDLILMDSTGSTAITSSDGPDQLTETVTTPGPGTYIVGVSGFLGDSAYLLSAGSTTTSSAVDRELTPVGSEFVAGELLVKYKPSVGLHAQAAKNNLSPRRDVWNGTHLMSIGKTAHVAAIRNHRREKINAPGHEANEAIGATFDMLRKLRSDSAVEYAEPNYIRRAAAAEPTDPFYQYQWHYRAINLPQAWAVAGATPGAGTIVAVIDTGILKGHPDLAGQLTDGYDFISNATNSADNQSAGTFGDIDNDPEDPGDGSRPGESSYHGTHVAGTIAAATNNGVGVAGIAWNAKIMPLRVLGKQGGSDTDIIEAMKYAARLPNASGNVPPIKADVINMSLGGAGRSATTQQVITAVRNEGVIIIAAAGNENTSTPSYPASYDSVVSVSAVGYDLKRAPYSNFGSTIDVSAPGGDTSVDLNGDRFADGVLSTLKDDSSTPPRFNYVFYQGTSMAAPHVAGVVALMRGVNAQMTPLQFDQLLDGSLGKKITIDLGQPGRDNFFGHGLIDAGRAVSAAKELGGGPPPSGSVLSVSVATLDFDSYLNAATVSINNGGTGNLTITSITADQSWIRLSPTSGAAPLTLNISVDRAGRANGVYRGNITINSNATTNPSTVLPVVMRVAAGAGIGDVGEVFVLLLNPDTGENMGQTSTTAALGYRYTLDNVPPGKYNLIAGTDRDDDAGGLICDIEDACGTFGELLTIDSAANLTGIDFPVNNSQNPPPPGDIITSTNVPPKRNGLQPKKNIRR